MALSVTHTFVSAIPDDADATLVRPSNWNAAHALSGVLPVANGGTGITSFGTGIDIFLGTPTSANLAAAVTNETGTGALVFANTPAFVTPILGTPTSGNLANCTGYPVGSISGTVPATAGGTGLTSYAVGDIVYADTTSTLAKLADVATGNALISGGVSTAPSWGKIALATAVSGNLPVTNLNSGTNADNTHFWRGDGTWAVPASGGTPGGSSLTVQYNNASAFGGMSGTSWDDTNRSLTMTGATVTTSNPVLNMTQTWNAGAVTFQGIKLNVTNTSSSAGSELINLTASGLVFCKVQVNGNSIFGTSYINTNGIDLCSSVSDANTHAASLASFTSTGWCIGSDKSYGWANSTNAIGAPDTTIRRGGAAATLQLGAADAATAVAQTTQVQSVVAGTSNIAGADWTFQGSRGTGTGVGGSIIFNLAPDGSAGSPTVQNAAVQAFKISPPANVVTTARPSIQVGSGSTTSMGWIIGTHSNGLAGMWGTDTAVSGTNFVLGKDSSGNTYLNGTGLVLRLSNTTVMGFAGAGGGSGLQIGGSADLTLTRVAGATLQFGLADAATAIAQTTQVQSIVAGTANGTAGADWTFKASSGTGTGTGGNIIIKTPFSAKSSGTGQGTWVDRGIYISKGKVLTSATPVSLFEIALPALAMAGGTIYSTIICTNGTDMQSFSQTVSYSVVNKAGVYTKSITATTGDKSVTGASTLTTAWTLLDGTNKSTVQVSATTSLTPSTNSFICYYSMANNSEQATTIL